MEGRQIILNVVAIFSLLLQACGGKEPTKQDVIGTWKSIDGAIFILKKDGTFTEKSFPIEFVFQLQPGFKDVRFDGSGKWELKKENSYWEVYLDFEQVSNEKCRSAFPLLISGENGILENKPPWYLFVWKGEEGGDRYKFIKK